MLVKVHFEDLPFAISSVFFSFIIFDFWLLYQNNYFLNFDVYSMFLHFNIYVFIEFILNIIIFISF